MAVWLFQVSAFDSYPHIFWYSCYKDRIDSYTATLLETSISFLLVYTLNFTAKTYVFGPISDVTSQIIKKTTIGYVAGTPGAPNAVRDLTYQVTPRAVKDYDGSVVTFLSQNLDLAETVFTVDNPDALTVGTYIYVGQEEMLVEKILDGKVIVKRAQDNTVPQKHVLGSKVYSITEEDDKLIQFGDDFGFNGDTF